MTPRPPETALTPALPIRRTGHRMERPVVTPTTRHPSHTMHTATGDAAYAGIRARDPLCPTAWIAQLLAQQADGQEIRREKAPAGVAEAYRVASDHGAATGWPAGSRLAA